MDITNYASDVANQVSIAVKNTMSVSCLPLTIVRLATELRSNC